MVHFLPHVTWVCDPLLCSLSKHHFNAIIQCGKANLYHCVAAICVTSHFHLHGSFCKDPKLFVKNTMWGRMARDCFNNPNTKKYKFFVLCVLCNINLQVFVTIWLQPGSWSQNPANQCNCSAIKAIWLRNAFSLIFWWRSAWNNTAEHN